MRAPREEELRRRARHLSLGGASIIYLARHLDPLILKELEFT
jgi:hypothetical protein